MPLFSNQGEKVKRKLAERIAVPGAIIHFPCSFTTPPKNKFIILVYIDEGMGFFFINHKINAFKMNKPELLRTQIPILKINHDFLDADSYIDCCECRNDISYEEVISEIIKNNECVKGFLSSEEKQSIVNIITNSILYSPVEKDLIQKSLLDSEIY